MDRKKFLTLGTAGIVGTSLTGLVNRTTSTTAPQEARYQNGISPWPICLDTATIRPASLEEKVRIADEAGFDAIEPWDGELQEYEENGGSLEELGEEIRDRGLFVPSVIGLWNAVPPDQDAWQQSLEGTRNRMRMAAAIGSEHIQTIPNSVGNNYDTKIVAQRYRSVLEMGLNDYGIHPAIVFVKFFPLKTLGQAMAVALDANHPEAKIIPDTYHMYISEGGFEGLKLLRGDSIAIFQFSDAPASPAVDQLEDRHRVYPGDGILPLEQSLTDLKASGFTGCVSLELYNPDYWQQDLQEVAETGLRKTLEVIDAAGV